jgi:hypothetical protein
MKNRKQRKEQAFYWFMLYVIFIITLIFAIVPETKSQVMDSKKPATFEKLPFSRFSIASGLSTSWILGENPNSTPIYNRNDLAKYLYGGGFSGSQSGIMLRCTYTLDDESNFAIPFGLDYTFFSTGERLPLPNNHEFWFTNSVDVTALFLGLDYFFWKIPNIDVRTYLGVEIRASLIPQGTYTWEEIDKNVDTSYTSTIRTKSRIQRFGGDIKLGVEGVLVHPFYLNTSIGVGAINLIGRDNNHGELFTPIRSNDLDTETLTYNLYFTLLIQYKF